MRAFTRGAAVLAVVGWGAVLACDRNLEPFDPAEEPRQPDLARIFPAQQEGPGMGGLKPPSGAGKIRLINIKDLDLQPCGGTHVARTGEIGQVEVRKIEKKGRKNRRVAILID